MARRPPPAGDLLTWRHKPVSHRRGYGASRERAIPAPKETQAQREWVEELLKRGWLRRDWLMGRPSGGDVPDAKWAGVAFAMGQLPGWPDLQFASPSYHAPLENGSTVWVPAKLHGMEWKALGGELSDEQERIRQWFLANGWPYEIVRDATGAWKALQKWNALRVSLKL
jgi:hypothetical protein